MDQKAVDQGTTIEWAKRASGIFTPLRAIDRSWFPDPLREASGLIDAAMLSQAARRILCRCLQQRDLLVGIDAARTPSWAAEGSTAQRRIVLRLGSLACAPAMRRTVDKDERRALLHAVGEAVYHEALAPGPALIDEDVEADFREAVRCGNALHFIAAMGMSVLQAALPQDAVFVERCVRYLFPARAWTQHRVDVACDRERVARLLAAESDA